MAAHIVKHLEIEVGHQLENANQMVHIDENNEGAQQQQPVNPTLMALDMLKKRMTAHVQKTQLVNQKLAYRVICLEQQLMRLTSSPVDLDANDDHEVPDQKTLSSDLLR